MQSAVNSTPPVDPYEIPLIARESILKTRHIWLIVVGCLLFFGPGIVSDLKNNGSIWETVKAFAERLGEALIIGGIVAYLLDAHLVKGVNALVTQHVNRIKLDVFEGVMGKIVDKDMFSVFNKTVLRCPFYRDQVRLTLTLTCEDVEIEGKVGTYLRCEWHEKYMIYSLQTPSASHELDIAISTNEVRGLEGRCGVTKVMVGPNVYGGSPGSFIGKNDALGESRFREIITVPAVSPASVESFSIAYKTLTDSETFEINLPSKNVELEVKVIGCDLNVRGHIMCPEAATHGWQHGQNGVSHWIAHGAILPHQGISLSWSPV